MSVLFLIQFIIVLVCILLGARVGGIGLGVFGGLGLAILTFGFGLQPTSPPIDVMLMIMAVVSAAAAMEASGGLDLMIRVATRILRKNPKYITFMAPAVTYIFTIFAGTGHVAYSVLPVIAEVSRRSGIRPERPLSMAVIASQFSIVASPIAAAVTSAASYLTPYHISIPQILMVTIPSTTLGIAIACVFVNKMGKELKDDPEYQRRLKDPVYQEIYAAQESSSGTETVINEKSARTSLKIFISAAILVVILGSLDKLAKYLPAELMAHLRPSFPDAKGDMKLLNMPHVIEIVMLTAAAFIIMFCKPDGTAITRGSVFHAGMRAVIAIFGIAWLGDTLFNAHLDELKTLVSGLVETAPWTFACVVCLLRTGKQPRRNRRHPVPARGFPRHPAGNHGRYVRRGKRLLLHPELWPDYRLYRLRHHRHDPHRPLYPQPQLHDSGAAEHGVQPGARLGFCEDVAVMGHLCKNTACGRCFFVR